MAQEAKKKKQVIFVAAEAVPFSKTGGLADVVGELSQALAENGDELLVLSPFYPENHIGDKAELEDMKNVDVPFDGGIQSVHILKQEHNGVTYGFIDHPMFTEQKIGGYGDYNVRRNVLMSSAVAHVATKLGFTQPDIIHAHDWHTGYLPAMLKHHKDLPAGFTDKVKTIFTVHNGDYRGISEIDDALEWANLPARLRDSAINCEGYANAITAGCGFADVVTTVSPSYAKELRQRTHSKELALAELYPIKGIVNGITDEWNPNKDEFHPPFNAHDLSGKKDAKIKLCEEFEITDSSRPTIGLVSRIAQGQKGIDLFVDAVDDLVNQGWNVIVAGNGDAELMAELSAKANLQKNKGKLAYHQGYSNTDMTHRIIAGSDTFAIPSRYEPCGITQLQSMRSGTLPIASATGGLKDTIDNDKTGYLFDAPPTAEGLLAAAQRAYDDYDTSEWNKRIQASMAYDSTWHHSAEVYDQLYDAALRVDTPSSTLAKNRENYSNINNTANLRCYNMYPRQYDNYQAMTNDVPRIAEMGFNAIWINPLTSIGNIPQPDWNQYKAGSHALPPADVKRTQSLYAMFDPFTLNSEFANNPEQNDNEVNKQTLKKLTKSAQERGMTTMCDVAFSHMALDSPLVTGKAGIYYDNGDHQGKEVDTTKWFKHYKSGINKDKPIMEGVDSNNKIEEDPEHPGKPHQKMIWADTAQFDYSNHETREEIMHYLWRPYINKLVEHGFTGMRVDSIAQNDSRILNPMLAYFKNKVCAHNSKMNEKDVVILGETLGQSIEDYQKTSHLTHAYSSAFWVPGIHHTVKEAHDKDAKSFWRTQHETGENWFTNNMGRLEKEVIANGQEHLSGGAIGCPGSHDEQTIVNDFVQGGFTLDPQEFKDKENKKSFINLSNGTITHPNGMSEPHHIDELKNYIDVEKAEQAMREKMAQTMLIPNGGYFVFAGDEYMQAGPRSVFSDHQKGTHMGDLTDYVSDINAITKSLPPVHKGAWSTRRLGMSDDLIVIEKHAKEGYEGMTDVIILNTAPGKEVVKLTQQDIDAIASSVMIENRSRRGDVEKYGKHPTPEELARAFDAPDNHPAKIRVHTDRRVELSEEVKQVPDTRVGDVSTPAIQAATHAGQERH